MEVVELKKDRIYQKLKQAIISSKLPAGKKLPRETDFAKTLKVGRITLRSSLDRLEYEGYIKQNRKLKKELTRFQLLTTNWKKVGDISYKLHFSEEMEKGQILDAIGDLADDQVVLVITPSNLIIIRSNGNELTARVMNGLRNIGVKGGGRGNMLMGKIPDTNNFEIKLDEIMQALQ